MSFTDTLFSDKIAMFYPPKKRRGGPSVSKSTASTDIPISYFIFCRARFNFEFSRIHPRAIFFAPTLLGTANEAEIE